MELENLNGQVSLDKRDRLNAHTWDSIKMDKNKVLANIETRKIVLCLKGNGKMAI